MIEYVIRKLKNLQKAIVNLAYRITTMIRAWCMRITGKDLSTSDDD